MRTEQKQNEEISSMTTLDHNEEAKTLLKNLCNWCTMSEFRQFTLLMYVHSVGTEQYANMEHSEQLSMAMMLHKLTDFFEAVETWDSAEVLIKEQCSI